MRRVPALPGAILIVMFLAPIALAAQAPNPWQSSVTLAVPPLCAALLALALLKLLPRIQALAAPVAPLDVEAGLTLAYLVTVAAITGWIATPGVGLAVLCAGALCTAACLVAMSLRERRAGASSRARD